MTLKTTMLRFGGLLLCSVVFAGTALAGDKPKDGAPGNSENAPGQEKKAEQPTPPAAQPAQPETQSQPGNSGNAPGQAKKAEPAPAPVQTPATAAPGQVKKAAKEAPKPEKQEAKAEQKASPKAQKQESNDKAAPKPAKNPGSYKKNPGSYKETSSGTDRKRGVEGSHKHTICHATGSGYVMITPSVSGVFHGHLDHQGDRDIVPPFTYKGQFYSQNWDAAGQAIFASGCASSGDKAKDKEPKDKAKDKDAKVHGKVLICHRTGSATNPFVIINISSNGWLNGHSKHDGDKLIRQPVSPGEKPNASDLAFASANCAGSNPLQPGGSTTTTGGTTTNACPGSTSTIVEVIPGGVFHKTGSKKNPYVFIQPSKGSAHYTKHADDIIVPDQTITRTIQVAGDCSQSGGTTTTTTTTSGGGGGGTTTVTLPNETVTLPGQTTTVAGQVVTIPGQTVTVGGAGVVQTGSKPAASGVAGAVSPVKAGSKPGASGVAGAVSPTKAGQSEQPASGVLGATTKAAKSLGKTAATGSLPFTGIPLWIAALIGTALLAAGLTLRRNT